jgi:multiple sugar transport system permease protein
MKSSHLNKMTPYFFIAPAGVILALGLLYPIGYMIYASFLNWNPSQLIGEADWVGLKNYSNLLIDDAFKESLWVTLKFAFIVVFIEMVIGLSLALLLDRNIRGMSALRTIFNRTLNDLGFESIPWLSDSTWALISIIIADVWQWTPFIFILCLAALQSLPRSTLEAARLDGANAWQQALYIKIPLMMPVLIVTLLLRLIDAFKVLEVILVMTNGGPGLSTEIMALRISRTASEFRELGEAAAMSNYLLMLLLLLTILMFLYNKLMDQRRQKMLAAAEEG